VLVVVALGAGLGACGGSTSSHASTSASAAAAGTATATAPAASSASSAASSAAGSGTGSRSRTARARSDTTGTAGSDTAAASSGATASRATTTTAPAPVPSGPPAAPDGLRQTTGYATYELCAGACSGAVPASLRRPLHLPHLGAGARCPVSVGSSPVAPVGGERLTIESFIGSAWSGARVTWTASAVYGGPVLIRGRQLGGGGAVGFGEGHLPYDELQLLASGQGSPGGRGRAWITLTRVRGPGCYAYQADGTNFSHVIAFQAVA
jgi:hypothetical protein